MREYAGSLMIDGKNYFCPNALLQAFKESKASSKATETMEMMSGHSQLMVVAPKMFAVRATGRVAVRADFNASSAMTGIFARKVKSLLDSKTPFWMECDSVMSRDFATLVPADSTGLRWVTPTYPISPKASEPGDAVVWTGCLYVNGKQKDTGWTIDPAEGLVTFTEAAGVTLNSSVCLSYRWRMKAIVSVATFTDVNVGDRSLSPARLLYAGSVLFEQYFGTDPTWTLPVDAEEFDSEDVT